MVHACGRWCLLMGGLRWTGGAWYGGYIDAHLGDCGRTLVPTPASLSGAYLVDRTEQGLSLYHPRLPRTAYLVPIVDKTGQRPELDGSMIPDKSFVHYLVKRRNNLLI